MSKDKKEDAKKYMSQREFEEWWRESSGTSHELSEQEKKERDRLLAHIDLASFRHNFEASVRRLTPEITARVETSGIRAAQEANADYGWFTAWAQNQLPPILQNTLAPILKDSVKQGFIEGHEYVEKDREQKEHTWSTRIKKACLFIVALIVTAIVGYLLALLGLKP